ncbi:hypothetical protein JCM10207_005428 [Rhodosporidiobolus poonsookiae]
MATVTVTNLSPSTTSETLSHFFSFCGKITSIAHEGTEAKVEFAKESAAKTALMLTGGTLDGSTISVTSSDVETPKLAQVKPTAVDAATPAEKHGEEIEQEDKPRSAIVAEYLAHGYQLGDQAYQKAIDADHAYGISQRFLSFFNPLKEKAQPHVDRVASKVHEVDEKQGLSLKAKAGLIIGSKYYQSALSSPFGAKVASFYTQTAKTVNDIHEEALRIKQSKTDSASSSSPTASTSGSTSAVAPTLPHDAPLPSFGTASTADSGKALDKPLESTAAPLKG